MQARVLGDETVQLTGISSVESAAPGDLVFVDDEKNLALSPRIARLRRDRRRFRSGKDELEATASRHPTAPGFCPSSATSLSETGAETWHPSQRNRASEPRDWLMVSRLKSESSSGEGVHIGENTRIGAGSVIGANASIGRNCDLYPNVTLYPGVQLGDRVIVHSGAVLGSDGFGYVRDQATGRYEKFPQIGRLEIEDDVEIGANTTIDRGALDVTRIGRGVKIDNLVHIGHNCQIGENVVIAAQTGLSGSITIEKNVVLGGQVGIGEHARIEEGVMLGGQGGVLPNKVLRGKGIAFWGTPAKPVREYLKELAVLARLARKE